MDKENSFDANAIVKVEVEIEENDMINDNELTGSSSTSPCLLCLEVTESNDGDTIPTLPGSSGNDKVNQELWALFVLRHLLELPIVNIANLLRKAKGNSFSKWFVLCNMCKTTAAEAVKIYVEVLKLKNDLKKLQMDVKQRMMSLSAQFGNRSDNNNICEEIRSYFFKNNDTWSLHELSSVNEQIINPSSNDDQQLGYYSMDGDDDNPLYSPSCSTTGIKRRQKRHRACTSSQNHTKSAMENVQLYPQSNSGSGDESEGTHGCSAEDDDDDEWIKPKRKKRNVKNSKKAEKLDLRCQICLFDRQFRDPSSVARHMRRHELCKSSCPECNYPCINESAVEKHLRENKCNPVYKFKCDLCDFVTERRCNLSQHKAAKHTSTEEPSKSNLNSGDESESVRSGEDSEEEIEPKRKKRNVKNSKKAEKLELRCKICLFDRQFRNSTAFARHMKRHELCKNSCPECNYPCINESAVEKHLRENKCNPVYKFKCDMCDFVTERGCNLSQHKAAKHTSEEPPNGSGDESESLHSGEDNEEGIEPTRKKRNLKRSDKLLKKLELRCQICLFDRQFRDSTAFSRHMSRHELCKSSCPECNYPCISESAVEKHLRENKCYSANNFKCDVCDFVTERSCNLSQHKAAKHNSKEPDQMTRANDSIGNNDNVPDVKQIKQKIKIIFTCDICGLKTKYKQKFYSHRKQHQYFENCEKIGGKLKCKVCGELTGGSNDLRRHTRESHSSELGIAVFQCSMCEKTFSRQDSMDNHIAQVHTKQCRFNCKLCEFKTMKKVSFLRHMQLHSSEKTFVCDLCGAAFKGEETLRTHKRKVHDPSRDNLEFRCKYCTNCDVIFLNKSLLNRHMKDVHKDLYVHKCDQCENVYLSAQSLKLHRNISHGDNTETECQFCKVKVLSPFYLYGHYQKSCKMKPPGFEFKTLAS